jgi:hypothetical protein
VAALPPCQPPALVVQATAQGATRGLTISIGAVTRKACLLPGRPGVRVLVAGRPVETQPRSLSLGPGYPRLRTLAPGRRAVAIARWENFCAPPDRIAVRVTIGARSVVRRLPADVQPPSCAVDGASSLAVSFFAARK